MGRLAQDVGTRLILDSQAFGINMITSASIAVTDHIYKLLLIAAIKRLIISASIYIKNFTESIVY